MSLITLKGLNKIQETQLAEEGTYKVTIVAATEGESEHTGRSRLECRLAFVGEPMLQTMTHFMNFAMEDDDDEKAEKMLRGVKRFLKAFKIDFDEGFDSDDLLGAEAELRVVRDLVDTDREGNKIAEPYEVNRIIVPKFQED